MNIIIAFLISVLTLFTVPPYATYDNNDKTLDTPIVELNGNTLREVFEDGNLVTNGDFSLDSDSDGLADGFSKGGSATYTPTLSNGIQKITATSNGSLLLLKSQVLLQNDVYYFSTGYERSFTTSYAHVLGIRYASDYTPVISISSNGSGISSSLFTPTTSNTAQLYIGTVAAMNSGDYFTASNLCIVSLSFLSLSNLTKETLDYYYSLYRELIDLDGATITYLDYDLHDIALIIFFGFLWLSLIILLKRKVLN